MTQRHRKRQTTSPSEPSYEERFELERAIARDEDFRSWKMQRRRCHSLTIATSHLQSRGYVVDRHDSGALRVRQDILLDDYVESCIEDRAILFNGLGA